MRWSITGYDNACINLYKGLIQHHEAKNGEDYSNTCINLYKGLIRKSKDKQNNNDYLALTSIRD